jgi:hypothetical protein
LKRSSFLQLLELCDFRLNRKIFPHKGSPGLIGSLDALNFLILPERLDWRDGEEPEIEIVLRIEFETVSDS